MPMDFITATVRSFLHYRVRAIRRYATDYEQIQRKTLAKLVRLATDTEWGRQHGFEGIKDYEGFAARVPLNNYPSIKPWVERMMKGERNLLWPGLVPYFATSSGTTSDSIKFIPVSARGLKRCHLMGGRDVTASYLDKHRESQLCRGYSLILSGIFEEKYSTPEVKVGDISAIMTWSIPSVFRRLMRFFPPLKLLDKVPTFKDKMEVLPAYLAKKRLTTFSGTPEWNLHLLKRTVEYAGKQNADELWPHLEVFTFGGTSLRPFRHTVEKLFPAGRLVCLETYNASEGFFGVQTDSDDPAMTLMLDYEVFFEFLPMTEFGKEGARCIPLWEVEPGVNYSVYVTTSSGLWRYELGDVIRFTRKAPYKFEFVGRTTLSLNMCGEDLSVIQAEKALAEACLQTGAVVEDFTVAPCVSDDKATVYHEWLMEFKRKPEDLSAFASILQNCVTEEDYDYRHACYTGTLLPLHISEARPGLFFDWLDSKGKLGGQHKIPRLSSTRKFIDELLELNRRAD